MVVPIISFTIFIPNIRLNAAPTYNLGLGVGLVSSACSDTSILYTLIPPPHPCICGYGAGTWVGCCCCLVSINTPRISMISGRKWPFIKVQIRGSIFVQLTGIGLLKDLVKLSFNESDKSLWRSCLASRLRSHILSNLICHVYHNHHTVDHRVTVRPPPPPTGHQVTQSTDPTSTLLILTPIWV